MNPGCGLRPALSRADVEIALRDAVAWAYRLALTSKR
jgi:hypothetical protein